MAEDRVQTSADNAIPFKLNIALAIGHGAVNLYQFFVLPLFFLPLDVSWGWTLLPLAMFNNPHWSLVHEAIHDLFHPQREINSSFGRMLSILFGSPFRILRLSHLLHHKLNRTPMEATEVYDRRRGSIVVVALAYYFQIFGGLYLVEFLSPLLFLLPRPWLRGISRRLVKPDTVTAILMRNWTQDDSIREIRLDGAAILLGFGFSLYCFGACWPLFAAILLSRAFLISFLDNVYHYRTPVNDIFYANNLRLPTAVARALLNFNFHGIHHRNPAIPWIRLPAAFHQQAQVFHGDYFAAAARQLCGPVALEDLPPAG